MALPPADANQGVDGGDQPTSEPSPAANDAQQAATPFGASEASGSDRPQDMVPRGMLDRLTQKMERQEAELAELKAVASKPQRPGYADEVSKLQAEAARVAMDDPMKAMELMGQASDLRAKATVNDALENLMQQQTAQAQQAQLQQAAEASWGQALKDYPELADQNSDLYKSANEIWQSDPYRNQDPNSMYKAVAMANERRLRSGKASPPSLEGAGAPTNLADMSKGLTPEEIRADVKRRMASGEGLIPLAEALDQNFDGMLTKPKGWQSD